MQEKIALYEEVLALEPGSRLFFPLAEMYLARSMPEKAEETLRRGISNHPDHLEAKLLLLEVLDRQGKHEELVRLAEPLIKALRGCRALWSAWETVEARSDGDAVLMFRLLGRTLGGQGFSWSEVISAGVDQVCGAQSPPVEGDFRESGADLSTEESVLAAEGESPLDLPGEDQDAEEIDLAELEEDVKTRTLADLLAYQEEFEQALLIYEQLFERATTSDDREHFKARMNEMRKKMRREQDVEPLTSEPIETGDQVVEQEKDRPASSSQVIETLSALADRLEQRDAEGHE
jgi:tetratricopeptide (TPR) repeat protein